MNDQQQDKPTPGAAAEQGQGQGQSEGRIEDLPSWAQDLIRKTRAEAAERRVTLEKAQKEAAEREQARLAEEGRWRELAEKRAADLAALTPYQQRAETLESMIRSSNEARINRLPEDMRPIVPVEYPPEKLSAWLDANAERLMKRPAPDLDAGAGAGTASTARLTDAEITAARKLGVTPEQYAKNK